jgi:AcrR family transcriptional regulator
MVERNTKQTVLDAATEMFAERGFDGTSMRELGATLGVTARALYRHFPDKDSLFVAATASLLDGVDALLQTPRASEQRLEWTVSYVELVRASPAVTRLVGAEIAWPRHADVGTRARDQDGKVRLILADKGPDRDARGAQALGLIWWPILCLRATTASPLTVAKRALAVGSTRLKASA